MPSIKPLDWLPLPAINSGNRISNTVQNILEMDTKQDDPLKPNTPFSHYATKSIKIGSHILKTGVFYTAQNTAHSESGLDPSTTLLKTAVLNEQPDGSVDFLYRTGDPSKDEGVIRKIIRKVNKAKRESIIQSINDLKCPLSHLTILSSSLPLAKRKQLIVKVNNIFKENSEEEYRKTPRYTYWEKWVGKDEKRMYGFGSSNLIYNPNHFKIFKNEKTGEKIHILALPPRDSGRNSKSITLIASLNSKDSPTHVTCYKQYPAQHSGQLMILTPELTATPEWQNIDLSNFPPVEEITLNQFA